MANRFTFLERSKNFLKRSKFIRKTLLPIKRRLLPSKSYVANPFFRSGHQEGRTLLMPLIFRFDQRIPEALTCIYEGIAHAWSDMVGPVEFIQEDRLFDKIDAYKNPVVFLSIYNFITIQENKARKLREYDCLAWVHLHPQNSDVFLEKFPDCVIGGDPLYDGNFLQVYKKLLLAEPKFVWNSVGESGREWYQDWIDDGFRFERIQLAADPHRYFPDPAPEKFGDIKMAYVGGYWKQKANAFDLYLRQFEEILVPFGYDGWPYKHYRGQLDFDDERRLYSSAGLVPLITGPAGWSLGELTERYYKAAACRAFCIADQNPALREFFSEDEMLQAESPEHFKYLVHEYLKGGIDTNHWREKAYHAVQERHLYRHRVGQILSLLEKER